MFNSFCMVSKGSVQIGREVEQVEPYMFNLMQNQREDFYFGRRRKSCGLLWSAHCQNLAKHTYQSKPARDWGISQIFGKEIPTGHPADHTFKRLLQTKLPVDVLQEILCLFGAMFTNWGLGFNLIRYDFSLLRRISRAHLITFDYIKTIS